VSRAYKVAMILLMLALFSALYFISTSSLISLFIALGFLWISIGAIFFAQEAKGYFLTVFFAAIAFLAISAFTVSVHFTS